METTDRTALPPTKDVRDHLEGLLGRDIEFTDGEKLAAAGSMVGLYVDDRLGLRAIIAFDLAMAAYAGAAIGLMPPGGAQDAVEEDELSPMLRENAAEVLNVMAALFNVGTAPHLRLYAHHAPDESMPTDVVAHLESVGNRVDWVAAVKGYGTGRLSIVLV